MRHSPFTFKLIIILTLMALLYTSMKANTVFAQSGSVEKSPIDSAYITGNQVTFQWNATGSPNPGYKLLDYWLNVGTGARNPISGCYENWVVCGFVQTINENQVVVTSVTLPNSNMPNFPNDGTEYKWNVYAVDVNTNTLRQMFEGLHADATFINGPPVPDKTFLSAPLPYGTSSGTSVKFTWRSAANAEKYHIQVFDDAGRLFDENTSVTSLFTSFYNFGDDNRKYSWRVRAWNSTSEYGPFSDMWQFTNYPSAKPDAPQLNSPSDAANEPGTSICFTWDHAARTQQYHLEISTSPTFGAIFAEKTIADGSLGSCINNKFENEGRTYFWRVKAENARGTTVSDVRSFDNGSTECIASNGSGKGVLPSHEWPLNTCQLNGGSGGSYYLKDVSRNVAIVTEDSTTASGFALGRTMKDADNVWTDSGQVAGVDAHYYASRVYEYFKNTWSLDSYDGSSPMKTVINTSTLDWAAWDPNYDQVEIGKPGLYSPFSGSLSFVAHEWGHALTGSVGAKLPSEGESGAVNEAFSDWLGITIEQANDGSSWIMGMGIHPTRNLADPLLSDSKSPSHHQSDYYGDEETGWIPFEDCPQYADNDNCFIHWNNGVLNKMFYLLAKGGTHRRGVTVQQIGIEKAINIAVAANRFHWFSNETFKTAADGMADAAEDLFSVNSFEVSQVKNAWAAVGVTSLPRITTSVTPNWPFWTGGSTSGAGDYKWGTTATVAATPATNYVFDSWTENDNQVSTEPNYSFTVNGSRSLVAHFAYDGPSILFPIPLPDFGTLFTVDTISQNLSVANYGTDPLNISSATITGDSDFSILPGDDGCSGRTLNYEQTCTIRLTFAPVTNGHRSATLTLQSNAQNGEISTSLTGTGVVPQSFYVVNAVKIGNGTIEPSPSVSVNFRSPQSFNINHDEGYHVASVTGCNGSLNGTTYTTAPVTADCTVTASFAINTYTVTAVAGTGGTILPSGITANYGSTPVFTITPNINSQIISVTGCNGTLVDDKYTTGSITADCTVTATFWPTVTITANAGTGGSISPSGESKIVSGASQTFSITPNPGYRIKSVSGCGGTLSGNEYTTGSITTDCTVAAEFVDSSYLLLTVSKSGTSFDTVTSDLSGITCGDSCTAWYAPGSTVTLTAISSDVTSTFIRWSGACTGTSPTCTITMDSAKDVTASFGSSSWAKTYGGSNNEVAQSILQTSDGGYIIAGKTESFGTGGSDAWVMKLDRAGNVEWQKAYGGDKDDDISAIRQNSEGDYIIAGKTYSFGVGSNSNGWILKLDKENGNVKWQQTYGGACGGEVNGIQELANGEFIVAGKHCEESNVLKNKLWIFKINGNGNILWQKIYSGHWSLYNVNYYSSAETAAIQVTSDGGYIVGGREVIEVYGAGYNGLKVFLSFMLRLNSDGSIRWSKTYQLSSGFLSVRQTTDGGYIVGAPGNYIIKLHPDDGINDGKIQWQKYITNSGYVPPGEWGISIASVHESSNNGYVAVGSFLSSGIWAPLIVKFDSNGIVKMQKTFSFEGGINSLYQTVDGAYIATSASNNVAYSSQIDTWVFKTDSNGNIPDDCITAKEASIGVVPILPPALEGGSRMDTWSESAVEPQPTSGSQFDTAAVSHDYCSPIISISPSSLDFGNVNLGSQTARTISLNNNGRSPLEINGLDIAGANAGEFLQTNNCSNVAAGGSCSITVTFLSIYPGLKDATLVISSNDPDTPILNVPFSAKVGNILTLTKAGVGVGAITSSPSVISCGANCSTAWVALVQGSQLTLAAVPDNNKVIFSGWSGGGCTDTNPCTVTLNADTTVFAEFNYLATADFTASSTTGNIPSFQVHFANNSSHSTSWLWNFGDGSTSTEQNPTHSYMSIGTYTVSLVASNPYGTDTKTVTDYITVQPCSNLPVRINRGSGTSLLYYSNLHDAYNAVVDQDVIEALAVNFIEDFNAIGDVSVKISGGYGCGYATKVGNSTLQGRLTTAAGTLTIGDFELVSSNVDNNYNIVAVATSGGSISPGGTVTVAQGNNVAFTVSPDPNFIVVDVLVDGISAGAVNAYSFSSVTTNHTIEAKFAKAAYTITVKAGPGGTVTPPVTAGRMVGNWNGSMTPGIGSYQDGTWYIDANGNNIWDGPAVDRQYSFGYAGALPVTGDWNGDGTIKIGVFGDGTWYLDTNQVNMANYVYVTPQNPGDPVWNTVGAADFNADGKQDILWRNTTTGENVVWYMDGTTLTGVVFIDSVPDLSWKIVGAADFNSDGKSDILWRHTTTGLNAVWFMDGAIHTGSDYSTSVPDLNWDIVGVGDFNNDSKPDILWRNAATGENAVWYMDGVTQAAFAYLDPVPDLNQQIVGVADFNGDGQADILFQHKVSGDLVVWFMNGIVRTDYAYLNPNNPGSVDWKARAVQDFNGDGKPDILFRNVTSGDLVVWHMTGIGANGVFDGGDKTYTFGVPGDLPVTGDWNGDGKTEIGVVRGGGTWFLDMNGNGAWEDGIDAVYSYGAPGDKPITGDWNGDGRTKIGVVRGNIWFLDMNGNGISEAGEPIYYFGDTLDVPITGDWTGDGRTKIGVLRGNTWYLDMNGNGAWEGTSIDQISLFDDWIANRVTVPYGASQLFTITPAAGYHIADVLVDGISAGPVPTYSFNDVKADHTIEAVFSNN